MISDTEVFDMELKGSQKGRLFHFSKQNVKCNSNNVINNENV